MSAVTACGDPHTAKAPSADADDAFCAGSDSAATGAQALPP
ncbi:hypothetical protein [Brevibacterium sp. NPDC059310]